MKFERQNKKQCKKEAVWIHEEGASWLDHYENIEWQKSSGTGQGKGTYNIQNRNYWKMLSS